MLYKDKLLKIMFADFVHVAWFNVPIVSLILLLMKWMRYSHAVFLNFSALWSGEKSNFQPQFILKSIVYKYQFAEPAVFYQRRFSVPDAS